MLSAASAQPPGQLVVVGAGKAPSRDDTGRRDVVAHRGSEGSPQVDVVVGRVEDVDVVVRSHHALRAHPQIGAATPVRGEPPHPAGLAQMALERRAGLAWDRDLEDDVRTDAQALADEEGLEVEAVSGEVLTERPIWEAASQLTLPPVELLAREGVDGLVSAAVVPGVAHMVSDESRAMTVPGLRRDEPGKVNGPLVDPRSSGTTGRWRGREVDRADVGQISSRAGP